MRTAADAGRCRTSAPTADAGRSVPTAVVAIAAAAVTAHGLVAVVAAAKVASPLSWAYPVITDGLAYVAYRATSRLTGAAAVYAWTVVVVAAGMSGLAQAVYLADGAVDAPPALRFAIGAWPAIAAAVAAHLLHLLTGSSTSPVIESSSSTTESSTTETALPTSIAGELPVEGEDPITTARAEDTTEDTTGADTSQTAAAGPGGGSAPEGCELDPRVRALVAELIAGQDVIGPQAAERFGCSPRTARRLLQEARTHLDTTTDTHPDTDPAHQAPVLHAVESA